jgi:acetylornithine deacetylase/succinyl-diaminopimelate desuccinylase-like protein
MTTTTATDPAIERFLDETRDGRLESYKELLRHPQHLRLPQHARTAGDRGLDRERAAADRRRERVGRAHERRPPVVYGDWLHAGDAPTVIVYGHYDVQPVDPLDQWTSPPFEPVVDDGRMLARGAADDKGQIHMHLRAAEALFATRGGLPINVRYVFEGDRGVERQAARGLESRPTTPGSTRTSRSSATPASSRATRRRSRSLCAE